MRPETPATLRWMHEDHAESVHPVLVVEDSADAIVLYEAGGTVGMHSGREKGGPRGRNLLPGAAAADYLPGTWTGDGVLRVHVPGQPWSVWRWLDAAGRWSDRWYVNLEEPWLRTARGFDTEDWILDLVLDSSLAWVYKDEDELEWARSAGRFDSAAIDRVRDAAAAAITVIEAGGFPFAADWNRWLPDPAWSIPSLTAGWDDPR